MRKILLLALALFLFAVPAHALTGKVLYIVCDKLGAASNTNAFILNNIIARTQAVQGWDYETCASSDSSFLGSLYQTNPCVGSADTIAGGVKLGSRYGRYDMAVMLNMPDLAWITTDAACVTYNMPHFGQMIHNSATWSFPIPLFVPFTLAMNVTNNFAKAYTGAFSSTARAGSIGCPYKDAQGDSLYLYTLNNREEALVATHDSTGYSFSHPLFWRYTPAREAVKTRYAHCWMVEGTGSHKVIWLPHAQDDNHAHLFPMIFAMFTKTQPIEMPVIAYLFGAMDTVSMGGNTALGVDTLGYGAGFKANVDYAVAQGIKLDIACYPYRMRLGALPVNTTQAVAYATAHPNNIRLTMSAGESWRASAWAGMLGGVVTGSYSQHVARIKATQDSCAVYYPIINTSRLDGYDGVFSDMGTGTQWQRADSILMALAARDITDIYNWNDPTRTAMYPDELKYQVLGPRRIWVNGKELRFHSINNIARYAIQVGNAADSLKKMHIDFAPEMLKRAGWQSTYVPYMLGLYDYLDGTTTKASGVANKIVMSKAQFSTGVYLPALTFCGGDSSRAWPYGAGGGALDQASQIRSNRSLFLDVMKQMNAMKKMGDYLVATYGTTGQSPYIWAWLDEVKWDRKNGRQFPNSHVRQP